MRLMLIAGLLALLLPAAGMADAPVQRRYYDVVASDAPGLAAAVTTRSPLGVTGLTMLAPSDIRWRARRVGGGYAVQSFGFDAVIVQTLPRWVNRAQAPACLQREWDRAMAALIRHEDQHVRVFQEHVARLRREALRLPPHPTPEALQQSLMELQQRLHAETMAWHRDYDRRTRHGQLEGAVIRPC